MLALTRRLGGSLHFAARSVMGRALPQDEHGQIAIGFLLMLLVVFMFFALAVDTGTWALDHREAQNQVDSAALAGALEMTNVANAQTQAEAAFGRNGVPNPADTGCPDAAGTWWFRAEVTGSGPGQIARVDVCQRRSSAVIFSALTNVLDIKVSARAAAAMYEEPLLYSIMAMHETACPGFNVSGQGQVQVNGGWTYTRSDCTGPQGALSVSGTGNAGIVSAGNEVVGNDETDGNATPTPVEGQWIDDPFNFLTQPHTWPEFASLPTITGNVNVNGAQTLNPGIYTGTVSVGNGDTLTLTEGLYVFRRGLSQTGGTITSNGDEVLLYSTCQNVMPCGGTDRAGDLSFSGGVLNLAGDLEHYNILFWMDRTSQLSNPRATLSLVGSSTLQLEGIAYSLTSHCHLSGQGNLDLALNMSFICSTIDFSGQANIIIDYDPIHAPVRREIALVE